MPPIHYKDFAIRSVNVKGSMKKENQELLAQDIHNNIDVWCLQQTKIKERIDINLI